MSRLVLRPVQEIGERAWYPLFVQTLNFPTFRQFRIYCVTSVCRDVKYVYIAVCLMVHSSQWLFVCKTWILPRCMPSCNF